jgi:CDP-4-dehydro-6-deoxyglucose reductase, E3
LPIMTLTIRTTEGKRFDALPDQTLLAAAQAAGVPFPYSCRTGRCSSCKCRVLAGATVALLPETGLSAPQQAEGWVLGCVRTARTNIDIEVEDLGGIVLPPVKTVPCRIHTLEKLAADVLRVTLRLPPTAPFNWLPGQYVDVLGPEGVRRSYSLANAPAAGVLPELHIRAVDGGAFSRYWFGAAKVGDLLRLNGPLGTCFLRGSAPLKAMLESLPGLPDDQRPAAVQLFWGGRQPADLYWTPPHQDGLDYTPVLSRPGPDWQGATGYVQAAALRAITEWHNATVYACGSEAMIGQARLRLVKAGLPERQFHADAFVCSAALAVAGESH